MTSKMPSASLRDRINRVAYVVINVSDLERSRAFYEQVTPLKVAARTLAPSQPFRGLDIESGSFDGYLMEDATGGRPTRIHLVEWKVPTPIGRHYPCFWHVGLAKVAILTPSAPVKLAQLKALGIRPTNDRIIRGYVTITDPDGVIISFPGGLDQALPAGDDPRWFERLLHTNPVVSDIRRSMKFYGETLGLDLDMENVPCEPTPASQGPGSDVSQGDSHLYIARGDARFWVDLSQFYHPPSRPETSAPFAEANHIGIARIGFEVDDIEACYAILRQVPPSGLAPGSILPPEEWDLGPEVGTQRVLCFRDPDGVRLELVEKVPLTPMTGCRPRAPGEPIVIDW